jgi:hypothetical protein
MIRNIGIYKIVAKNRQEDEFFGQKCPFWLKLETLENPLSD